MRLACPGGPTGPAYPRHEWLHGRCSRCWAWLPGMSRADRAHAAAARGDGDAEELAARSPTHVEAARRRRSEVRP